MNISKAISMIMKEKKVTQQAMAVSIGKKKATDVSARLSSKNLTFDKAIEMLNVLGYEVVIQPKKPGVRPQGQIVIEGGDKE